MISKKDTEILRRLAERKRALCDDPVNSERRDAWLALDTGGDCRPMILAEAQDIKDANRPVSAAMLECESDFARSVEQGLRIELYYFETLKDDHVLEPNICRNWKVSTSNYGVEVVKERGEIESGAGSLHWNPPITELADEWDQLKPRTFSVDREQTLAEKAALESVFNGLLDVELRGGFQWTTGLTIDAIDLIGLEGLMLNMYDEPEALHALMGFLRDECLRFYRWLESEKLLSLNNRNDYIGSGSIGYSNALPALDFTGQVRMKDLWILSESQETVGVSPEMFEEFIFPYQLEITKQFGRVYYGCCEPLDKRFKIIRGMQNLARVSVSPWADQEKMAQQLGRETVFSRKPSPTAVSTEKFDEAFIRSDLRNTLETAKDCRLEIIMKDVHTLNNQPERLPRWVELAREACRECR